MGKDTAGTSAIHLTKANFLVSKCSIEVVIKLPRLQREERCRGGRKKYKQVTIIILVIFCKSF